MKPLRILLAMIEPPLPFGNADARWYYVLLRGLVERGHRVTAFAACPKADQQNHAKELFPAPRYDLRLYPFPVRSGWRAKLETLRRPYSYMFSAEFREEFERERQAGYDVIHLEQLWCGWLVLDDPRKSFLNIHFLPSIDLAGTSGGLRWQLERWLLDRAENRILRGLPQLGALSDRLATAIRQRVPAAQVQITRLGIDLGQYRFRPTTGSDTAPPVIGLIGSMNWHPSASAARRLLTHLLPGIQAKIPNVRVLIVGWQARSALAEFVQHPGVEILENVPDAQPYFDRLQVLVYAPQNGSGVKVKIQEAFAKGVPVVTTAEGVEGMPALDGIHAGVAEDDQGLIDRVVTLLQNPAQAETQRIAARQMLEAHCGPTASLDVIEQCYANILNLNLPPGAP